MTKAELVARISKETGINSADALTVVESLMKNIKAVVAAGDAVYLRGFGSFERKTRKEKIARNISKNTAVVVPQHDIPYFKPSDAFAEML